VVGSELKEASEEWASIWEGSFHFTLEIKWLSFCELPFSKVSQLNNSLNDNEAMNTFRDC